ncbi:hypothetical protein OAR19_00530, partial [bacterium]|nr:hypothetical protein [bacterium]
KKMPKWDDQEKWQEINDKIVTILKFAKEAKFKGVVLDTTAYSPDVWNPGYFFRYKDISEKVAGRMIYQQARKIIDMFTKEFPQAVIIVTPIGFLTEKKPDREYHKYYYWHYFLNGIFSVEAKIPILLLAEKSQQCYSDGKLTNLIASVNAKVKASIDDQHYWQKKGFLIFSSWPLGRYDYDKKIVMGSELFEKQTFLLQKYSQKYVVIYSKGQAWWQTEEGEKYNLDKIEAKLKQDKNFDKYVGVLNLFNNKMLKLYFKKLKSGREVSQLEALQLF